MTKKLQKNQSEELQHTPLEDNEVFATYDLGCAAALITAGFEISSLDKSNLRKVQFIFRRAIGLEKIVDDFWADRLEIKARAFFDNTKSLKNRIYSEQNYVVI